MKPTQTIGSNVKNGNHIAGADGSPTGDVSSNFSFENLSSDAHRIAQTLGAHGQMLTVLDVILEKISDTMGKMAEVQSREVATSVQVAAVINAMKVAQEEIKTTQAIDSANIANTSAKVLELQTGQVRETANLAQVAATINGVKVVQEEAKVDREKAAAHFAAMSALLADMDEKRFGKRGWMGKTLIVGGGVAAAAAATIGGGYWGAKIALRTSSGV